MKPKTIHRILAVAALSVATALLVTVLVAQQSPTPGSRPGRAGRVGAQSCAQQVGISPGVMEQMRTTRQGLRSQMEAVCSNSSLSNQQKVAKLREIRESMQQQMNALITPEQREALQACQRERSGGGAMPGVYGGVQGGPQGGVQDGPRGGVQGGPQGGIQGGPQSGVRGGEGQFNPCRQFTGGAPPAAKAPSSGNTPPASNTPPP